MSEPSSVLTGTWVENVSAKTGLPHLQVEYLAQLMQTAYLLREKDIILKGGTAVQQFIKEQYRRVSLDLDYDLAKEMQVDSIRSLMDMPTFKGGAFNRFTKTLTYRNIVPTNYKSETRLGKEKFNAHLIKVQINSQKVSKNHVTTEFNALPGFLDEHSFKQKILPPEALLANKIVVSAKSEKVNVGRARYKDLFDVLALANHPKKKIDYAVVAEELGRDLRSRGSSVNPKEALDSCSKNLEILSNKDSIGFYSSYKVSNEISKDIKEEIELCRRALEKIL